MLALRRARAVMITLAAALSLYALASLTATLTETKACGQELARLEAEAAQLEKENSGLLLMTQGGMDEDTAERLARERLGLAYPGDTNYLSGDHELHTGG